jgi:DNA-binding MarR family transcriptional regulator
MNADRTHLSGMDQHRSLQILEELSNNDSLTQRDLSSRLGIALGLVNSYIKNLVAKGYLTVKAIPPKRYAYYLTPKGFTEKTRLTYDLLHDYTRVYREARNNLKTLFHELQQSGTKRIVFAGADEVAEIAYITLQETQLELAAVMDGDRAGETFFNKTIKPMEAVRDLSYDTVVVTSYVKRERYYAELIKSGVPEKTIRTIWEEHFATEGTKGTTGREK